VLLPINLKKGLPDLLLVFSTWNILDEIILGLMAETQGHYEGLSYQAQRILGWLEWQDFVITFHFDLMYPFGNTLKFLLWIEAYNVILIRIVNEERFSHR
jgi:hypothetical protein